MQCSSIEKWTYVLDAFVRPVLVGKRLSLAQIHQLSLFSRRLTVAARPGHHLTSNIISSGNSDSDHFAVLGGREVKRNGVPSKSHPATQMNWAPTGNHFLSLIYCSPVSVFLNHMRKGLVAEPEEMSAKLALLTDAETGT